VPSSPAVTAILPCLSTATLLTAPVWPSRTLMQFPSSCNHPSQGREGAHGGITLMFVVAGGLGVLMQAWIFDATLNEGWQPLDTHSGSQEVMNHGDGAGEWLGRVWGF